MPIPACTNCKKSLIKNSLDEICIIHHVKKGGTSMPTFRIFSFISNSFLNLTTEKKKRNKWTLSVFGGPDFNYNKVDYKYYKILSDYYYKPAFDNSPESLWNDSSERELLDSRDSKKYTDDFDKIKSVPECLRLITKYQKLKNKYKKIVLSEMKKFAVEMVDRGMDPLDVFFLCSVDTSWARLYHIFSYHYVQMYSPRAHFISLTVQRVELFNLYLQKFLIELPAAIFYKYNPAEEVFRNTIIEKRRLISQDSYFFQRLKAELPQLPMPYIYTISMDLKEVIDRIRRITPTVEATKIEKEFIEEIRTAMDEPIQKQMKIRFKLQEQLKEIGKELRHRDKEYWAKLDRDPDLKWDKLLQKEIQKMKELEEELDQPEEKKELDQPEEKKELDQPEEELDQPEEKKELDQPEEELDQPEEELDQPEEKKELDQPEEELDQPDKELDLNKPIKQQKKKPAKPLKQKKKNSNKDKNS